MKKSFSIYRSAIFTLLVDPLFYVSSIIIIIFCSFRFFFAGRFFIENIGTTDLRQFFQSVPYISILTIPLVVFRQRNLITDDSVPFSPTVRFVSLVMSSFTAFALPILILSVAVPISVNMFGDVDFGQVVSGVCGVLLYGMCAVSLCVFLFTCITLSPAIPLFISMLILAVVDFVHLLPLYSKLGKTLTFFLQKLSFAWHFDSFGKGIVDSRNVFFYIFASFLFIVLSNFFEYRRIGRKVSKLTSILLSMILIFVSISAENVYFRFDFTKTKSFSISDTSKKLVERLSSPLRITYYRSNELKELYPQSSDVAEFLQEFSQTSGTITFSIEKADPEKLSRLKIQGRQFQSNSGTKMEFVTVYSAIVLQYLEKQTIIPFVLTTETLEFDLAQRIQQLITGNQRRILVIAGNGRSMENSYSYVVPLLSSFGFTPEIADLDENLSSKIDSLTSSDELLLLGTSSIDFLEAESISQAFKRGVPSFIATSPYNVPIEDAWSITKNSSDRVLPILNSLGFAIGNSLVEDISCFPLTMQSGEGNTAEYVTVNYPLWVSILPQKDAKSGCTLFWASPLRLYGDTKPLLETTDYAWIQKESDSESMPFLTDPFNIPKTAKASDAENNRFILAATNGKITVVTDQYFVDTMMTGFISGQNSADLRNFTFLSSQLLKIRGDEKLSELMEKAKPVTTLFKITGTEEFLSAKSKTVAVNFIILPILFVMMFVYVSIKRLGKKQKKA